MNDHPDKANRTRRDSARYLRNRERVVALARVGLKASAIAGVTFLAYLEPSTDTILAAIAAIAAIVKRRGID